MAVVAIINGASTCRITQPISVFSLAKLSTRSLAPVSSTLPGIQTAFVAQPILLLMNSSILILTQPLTDEPVEYQKLLVQVQEFRRITDDFGRIYI